MKHRAKFSASPGLGAAASLLAVVCLLWGAAPSWAVDARYQNQMRAATRYMVRGQHDMAVKILEAVIKRYPEDLRASMTYADALLQLERFEETEAFLEEALGRVNEKADLYRMRVRLRRAQDRPPEAFEDVLTVMDLNADRASWAYRETQELLREGLDPEKARERVLEQRELEPEEVTLAILNAAIIVYEGEDEAALRYMIAVDRDLELDGSGIRRFASEMQSMGREDLALEGLLAAVERVEKAVERSTVFFQIADIQERQGKYRDALASLRVISEERKGTTASGRAMLKSAEIHQKYLDDPQGALMVYEQVRDDPILGHHRPEMLLAMADCYVRLGRFAEAAGAYGEVRPEALDPEQAELAALKLADVEFYRGDPEKALELYQDMAETHPRSLFADDAAGRYILLNKHAAVGGGVALETLGRMEWARMMGDSMIVDSTATALIENYELSELAAEALLALAEVAEAGGNPQKAIAELERLVAQHPQDRRAPEALMRQGRMLETRLGRRQEALMRYEAVLTDYPQSVQKGDARRHVERLRRELKS
jgi:tetratricopeptide (TPR) repeat protein